MDRIRYCYQKHALGTDPKAGGELAMAFVVRADGTVTDATAKRDTVGISAFTDCMVARFQAMTFPKPKGGGIVKVTYPFVFEAQATPSAEPSSAPEKKRGKPKKER